MNTFSPGDKVRALVEIRNKFGTKLRVGDVATVRDVYPPGERTRIVSLLVPNARGVERLLTDVVITMGGVLERSR